MVPRDQKAAQDRSAARHGKEATAMKDLAITHPDKVLDPESGMTKQQLAEYYMAVAEHLLPHIADRPHQRGALSRWQRQALFFSKARWDGSAGWSEKRFDSKSRKVKSQKLTSLWIPARDCWAGADGSAGNSSLGFAQRIAGHARSHRLRSRSRRGDRMEDAGENRARIQARLKKVGLESFVKSTGGKGLHVVVPIRPDHEWPAVKEFAHRMVLEMEHEKSGTLHNENDQGNAKESHLPRLSSQ